MTKKIRSSTRGLTFSTDNAEAIGTKYRYVIDIKNNQVLIIADADGKQTVSRKKSGKTYKALYDIRSSEVKALVSKADYMEVEETGEEIIVHVYRKARVAERILRRDIVSIEDILAVKSGEIRLLKAAGCEGQLSFEDVSIWENLLPQPSLSGTVHAKEAETIFKVISLFSGAGLLDYQFAKKAWYKFVYANDACTLDGKFCKELADTYSHNIGCKMTVGDIREVLPEMIPDGDVVIGGPCCQAYSNANRHNIDTDEGEAKRHLIDDYVRIVKAKHPKCFVIENVPQILSKNDGKILNDALSTLDGYEFTATVVSDDEIGGYTIRKRAIIIGSRIGKITLPDVKILPKKTVRDALSKIDGTWETYKETESCDSVKLIMSYVPEGGNWKDVPPEIRYFGPSTQSNTYHRLAWDAPARTITNWRKCCLTHPSENRIISINEAAALMGLDKGFKFFGGTGNIQQMIGNGVTGAIASFIEKHITRALKADAGIALA